MQQRNQRQANYQPGNEWSETNNRGTDGTNTEYSESDVQNSRQQQRQQHYNRGGQPEGYSTGNYNDSYQGYNDRYQGYNDQYDNRRGNQWRNQNTPQANNGYNSNQDQYSGSRNLYGSQYDNDNYSGGNQNGRTQQNTPYSNEQYGRQAQYSNYQSQENDSYGRGQQFTDNYAGWENGSNTRENRFNQSGSQSTYNQNNGSSAYGQSFGQGGPQYGSHTSYGSAYSHKGKGPKGYQRSDERITEDINDRLTDDHHLDASSIEVHVTNGEVKLTGTVESREAKRRAEDLSESISGVANVENSIKVKQENKSSDSSIRSSYSGSEDGLKNADKNKSTSKA